jgi:hypothetical protein
LNLTSSFSPVSRQTRGGLISANDRISGLPDRAGTAATSTFRAQASRMSDSILTESVNRTISSVLRKG